MEPFTEGSYERRLIGWGFAYGRHSAAGDVLDLLTAEVDMNRLIDILIDEVAEPEVEGHPKFEVACEMLLDFTRPIESPSSEEEDFQLEIYKP